MKYPRGTIVEVSTIGDNARVACAPYGGQSGTPVVKPGATFVVVLDSPTAEGEVIIGLRSGWAGLPANRVVGYAPTAPGPTPPT